MTGFDSKRQMAQAKQEPTPWRDMVTVSLVREGINKHKARELADHFAAEPEPVAYYHPRKGFYWAKPTSIFAPTSVDVEPLPLYTAPPAQRPWVGLTDEEKKTLATAAGCTEDDDGHIVTEIFRLAETKLKEKNDH